MCVFIEGSEAYVQVSLSHTHLFFLICLFPSLSLCLSLSFNLFHSLFLSLFLSVSLHSLGCHVAVLFRDASVSGAIYCIVVHGILFVSLPHTRTHTHAHTHTHTHTKTHTHKDTHTHTHTNTHTHTHTQTHTNT